jgi:hypothetical protein
MSAENSELEDNLSDLVSDLGANTVEEYRTRDRMVKRAHGNIDKIVSALLTMRGLNSPNRGMSVARINNARGTD